MMVNNMFLNTDAYLQGGKYKIIRSLGQGGFGITYEAEQVALHRRVAIKEFFMKDYCERDESTSHVTLGASSGSKELVEKFRTKFIREAQMIAEQDHPHIVKIHDVFEENGTAYYVMEFLEGGSLSDLVNKTGPLPESQAIDYIRQVGDALSHLHEQNCLHFDVKPSNILLNRAGKAVLIDFGISKHYDEAGSQTSSTPVGISKGYAPLEQYQQAEITTFTPATDIYALGATLYFLLTGQTPPSASEVNEDGLQALPSNISTPVQDAINKAMSPRRKDRPQCIGGFFDLLKDETIITTELHKVGETTILGSKPKSGSDFSYHSSKPKIWIWILLGIAIVYALIMMALNKYARSSDNEPIREEGCVTILSSPNGAHIWVDGKDTKLRTPASISDITPGDYSVVLVADGYYDYETQFRINCNDTTSINAKMKRITMDGKDPHMGLVINVPLSNYEVLNVNSMGLNKCVYHDFDKDGKSESIDISFFRTYYYSTVLPISYIDLDVLDNDFEHLQLSWVDLDRDGVDELILSTSNGNNEIFYYQSGEFVSAGGFESNPYFSAEIVNSSIFVPIGTSRVYEEYQYLGKRIINVTNY